MKRSSRRDRLDLFPRSERRRRQPGLPVATASSAFGFGFARLCLGTLGAGSVRVGTLATAELAGALLPALMSGLMRIGTLTRTELTRALRSAFMSGLVRIGTLTTAELTGAVFPALFGLLLGVFAIVKLTGILRIGHDACLLPAAEAVTQTVCSVWHGRSVTQPSPR
jgi:hypothetical protein